MSDDTTKITATLPNDVVDGVRQLGGDKHLTLTAALGQAITTSKFINAETKDEKGKRLIKKDNGEFAGRSSSRRELRIQVEKREGDAAMSSPVLDLDAEKPVLDASPRPQRLATVPYDPGPEREGVRTKLAIGSAIVTAGIGITPLFWALVWHNPVNVLLTGIFTPFFGLTGTVIGFL